MNDRLSEMLELQRELQNNTYGIDPSVITAQGDMSFIKDMVIAATDELHEVLGETRWKPWTTGPRTVNVENYKKEMVDLFHFFMNLMLAVDMTADELYDMYRFKRQVNIKRQEDGYDGVSTKCPRCTRALEDVALTEVQLDVEKIVLCVCGETIPKDIAAPFLIN